MRSRGYVRVPDDLVALVAERRVIPFVGAGFSAGLGLPQWEALLRRLSEEVDSTVSFDEILQMTNGDYLQVAEYLYIKSDKRIGPLRHVIEGLLGAIQDPVKSAAHVELVNLGAPQVYTTNYDDLIERTYRGLGIPVSVVALPKDVANSDYDRTQVVKYHGDLRHENTLVLTESAYYRRLDLESPMDLKFRSDILGRSVLFMGYSFRDVNIRLIWFKLMQMMQDIPPDDRRASYMLKLGPNPVQDALFRDVGLHPITLDPNGDLQPTDRSKLLADFLAQLASAAGADNHLIPGGSERMFVSTSMLESISSETPATSEALNSLQERFVRGGPPSAAVVALWARRVPLALREEAGDAFRSTLPLANATRRYLRDVLAKAEMFGPSTHITDWFMSLLRGGTEVAHETRADVMRYGNTPWRTLLGSPVSKSVARDLISALKTEVDWNLRDGVDDDIVFLSYVVKLLLGGMMAHDERAEKVAIEQLSRASEIYPEIAAIEATRDSKPPLDDLLVLVERKRQDAASEGGGTSSDTDDISIYFDTLASDLFEDDAETGEQRPGEPG